MAFTKMVVEQDDSRVVQFVLSTVWRDASGTLRRFRFSLHDAIATGDTTLVRRTLASNDWICRNITVWTWFTAVAYFRGDPTILTLLKTHAVPAWTGPRIRHQIFRRDLHTRATQLFQTVDVACVRWFVDNFGAASLPSHLLVRLDGRLARFLSHVADVIRHRTRQADPHRRPANSERLLTT